LPVDGAYNTDSEFIRKGFLWYLLRAWIVRAKYIQQQARCDEKHTVTNK